MEHANEWAFLKNMPFALFWVYLPIHVVANLVFLLKYIRERRGKVFFKAKIDALKGLGKALAKRKIIQSDRRVSVREINRLFNKNLLAPFLVGRNLRRYNREHASKSKTN